MPERAPEPQGPVPAEAGADIFPGPLAAILLTLAGIFATALITSMFAGQPYVAAIGIGSALGLGGVATLAARRVGEPQAERLGLRGFDPALTGAILSLLPISILVSEVDNWVRMMAPQSEQMVELAQKLQELTKVESVYAGIQTGIVALGITPVVEGFFFFGVVLQGVVARLGRLRGVLLTAALYSLVHFPIAGAATDAIVPVFSSLLIGSLFGLTRLASGSILPCMLLASLLSAISFAAYSFSEQLPIAGFNADGSHTSILVLLPCLLAVAYGASTLYRLALETPIQLENPEREVRDEDEGFHF